ncbi:hypothetical protein GZ77_10870 [Endozoicomonas montiporae]|uniref:Uncharacterized protein n=1 Tax=Endozoicomonas montiporae TaxID=1027273 RepID=A0A081N8K7_9GAMM|nr:hypothetical protein GZ77_10870 [Endozoicomonas montiporae]
MAALAGCASTGQEPVADVPAITTTVSSLADITYVPIKVYNQTIAIERPINSTTEVLQLNEKNSPVAGWKLPDYGVYQFKVESLITRRGFGTRAEAFTPEIWLLDSDFKPLQKLPASRLKYDEQSMLTRENLSTEFVLDNRTSSGKQPAYLLALTTEEARQVSLKVANFDEEYARIRARTAPPTGDIYTEAVADGTLRLQITPLLSQPARETRITPPPRPDYVPSTPDIVQKDKASNVSETINQDYLDAVQSALDGKDINQALSLRSAIRQLHITLQQQFSASYDVDKSSLKPPASLPENAAIEASISYYYQQQIILALKQDNPQAALAWIDQVDQLAWEVDQLF